MLKLRLALHGGLLSGKSTLATALEERGFAYINYTRLLKQYAVGALEACGITTSLMMIEADKEKYRRFLIELGDQLGFDHGFGIDETLAPIIKNEDRLVFDNVRFPAQMDKLVALGFRMVRIDTPMAVREERAAARGMSVDYFLQRTDSYSEVPLPEYPGEIRLSVDGPMDDVLVALAGVLTEAINAERLGSV
jgi:hypothetical protein